MTDTKKLEPSWGIKPPTDTNIVAAWGARAIYKPAGIDDSAAERHWRLTGKQSRAKGRHVPAKIMDVKRLKKWVNTKGLRLLSKLSLVDNSKEIVTYTDGPFTITASPKGSHGYLYIGAWVTQAQSVEELG